MPEWETYAASDTLRRLGTSHAGLDDEEARARLAAEGPNTLPRPRQASLPGIFVRQFVSPLIVVLAVAGGLALAIGAYLDAGFVAAVLVLNAAIGAVQEWRAERGAQALHALLRVQAYVVRAGSVQHIPAEGLVPGDVVRLEPGMTVPADLRLVSTQGLETDEALLTGESVPVGKDASWQAPARVPAAERRNLAHGGTLVVRGRGTGVVVATGGATEVGTIAREVAGAARGRAPLLVRMDRFARSVGAVVIVAAVVLVAFGITRGGDPREMILFGIAAAVSAVPEGLPIALTVALSVAAVRMARRRVIVRRLAAVEGLGSCTFIATDKTGTLTMNALTVRELRLADGTRHTVTGEGYEPVGDVLLDGAPAVVTPALDALLQTVVRCNEATLRQEEDSWFWRGDPTDIALVACAIKAGVAQPQSQAEAQIPFEPESRFAAERHSGVWHVKGAPERVLAMCADGPDATRAAHAAAEAMARAGLRVLAIARGADGKALPERLSFLGLVGMLDPPRPGVRESIAQARAAGMEVVMVTGDHPTTAAAIARDVGIPVDEGAGDAPGTVMTGDRLDVEGPRPGVTVYARVTPGQKLQIVESAKAQGHFVAVTGDGVNDAPALRAAHIGVAMGKEGTDVARQAADIVLADDAFPSIVAGVEEGRIAYRNIRNVVFLLVSTGAAELVLLFLALAYDSPLPLLPAQLLWLNLVTSGIQDVALAVEPGRGNEMKGAPRHPQERIFDRTMVERTLLGALVMGGGGFVVFQWLLESGWEVPAARNALLLLMVLFENLHVGNSRHETASAFSTSPLRNPFLLLGVLGAQALHIAALYIPFMQTVLRTEPVTMETWVLMFLVALTVTVAFEVHKWLRRRRPLARRPWPEAHALSGDA